MKKGIVGVIVTIVIGGTGYTISQSDVVSNFSKETGQSQEQAQQYVNDAQKNLESFSKIGQEFIDDGNAIMTTYSKIDCVNYTYTWQTQNMDCTEGANELQTIGNNEILLGNCYKTLDANLGNGAVSKMSECITDIDSVDADYDLPIAAALIDSTQITTLKNTNIYNKSVLKAALKSK